MSFWKKWRVQRVGSGVGGNGPPLSWRADSTLMTVDSSLYTADSTL